MEQFRQFGESLGKLKALMVFRDEIEINQRQCCFLLDSLSLAYEAIAEEMTSNLKFEDRHTKWRVLEQPLKELHKVCKEAEAYIRQCFETKELWWAKVILLHRNRDCVEYHVHNLLCCIPVVIDAIETAGELCSLDQDQVQKRRLFWSSKYQNDWNDLKLFQWRYGKQYLVSPEFCTRMDTVWKEDRWILLDKIREKQAAAAGGKTTKHQQHQLLINHLLLRNLDHHESAASARLLPSTILLGAKDYQVRRRLGDGGQYKEILWLGESFVLRHIKPGEEGIEPLIPEICQLLTLAHPNILQILCGFSSEEEEKNKECFLLTELMSKNMSSYMKELCNPRKQQQQQRVVPLSLTSTVVMMLQIARGMEYLHSKRICHGDLNPSNILIRTRSSNCTRGGGGGDLGFLQAKVSGFGLSSVANHLSSSSSNETTTAPSYIWHAPEVLSAEQEDPGGSSACAAAAAVKYTDKCDVYSFGMICFEILTGKVPFEDAHLQGEKMSRNIRAGERPLFPFNCPRYLVTLTKKCWHSDPNQRPSFSSICRILRYIKRFLLLNPDHSQAAEFTPPIPPLVDYHDIEAGLLRKFPSWRNNDDPFPVSEIPFQMFAYRVMEKERSMMVSFRDTSESGSEGASISGDETVLSVDEPFLTIVEKKIMASQESISSKRPMLINKRSTDTKANKYPGTPKTRSARPPQLTRSSRSLNKDMANRMLLMSSTRARRHSGHASDSELS
ncbi:hypothetical protein Dimus_021350 [Dionaea muscipula]